MKKVKHTGFDARFLHDEECAVIEAAERGELQAAPDLQPEIAPWQAAAARMSKKKAVTVRLQEQDIQRIKAIAHRKGVPYQTLVSSVIHQYATEGLREAE
jgi:predicted DNA binding CopG/RHH family protein